MQWKSLPVVGQAYTDEARPWSIQDTCNLIPELSGDGGTFSKSLLRSAPGLTLFSSVGSGVIRGMHSVEGALFVVRGNDLLRVASDGTISSSLGTIPGVRRCSMAHNAVSGGNQLVIANGVSGYVYDTSNDTFTHITDEGFPGAKQVGFLDGYIVAVEPGQRFAFTSMLNDALSYNTLDRYQAEAQPDAIVGQAVVHREWWLFGSRTVEIYRDTGAATGTFQRISTVPYGCAEGNTIATIGSSPFWLGQDGIVFTAQAYQAKRISTAPIEQDIAKRDYVNAFAFTWVDRGHSVYYLTFPDGMTWGYDLATGVWHRRQSYGFKRWRVNALVKCYGKWLAGDYTNGKVYELDWANASEDGATLERRRTFGVTSDSGNRMSSQALRISLDVRDSKKKSQPWQYLTSSLYPIIVSESLNSSSAANGVNLLLEPTPLDSFGSSSLPTGVTLTTTVAYKSFSAPVEALGSSSLPTGVTLTTTVAYKSFSAPPEAIGSSSLPTGITLTVTTEYVDYAIPSEAIGSSSLPTGITLQ